MIDLAGLRIDEAGWSEFGYQRSKTAVGALVDAQAEKRYALLLRLQYDRLATDEPLIRYLVRAEIKQHQEAEYQGLEPSLRLALFLLARYKRLADLKLLWMGMNANFDTQCGIDKEYLFLLGIEETTRFLRGEAADLWAEIDQIVVWEDWDDAYIESWWAQEQTLYPDNEAGESFYALCERYAFLAEIEKGVQLVRHWDQIEPESKRKLSTLVYQWDLLGQYEEGVQVRARQIERAETAEELVSYQAGLLFLYQKLERWGEIERVVGEVDRLWHLPDEWQAGQMGGIVVQAVMRVLPFLPEKEVGRRLWRLVDQWIRGMKGVSWAILEMGQETAVRFDDTESVIYYEAAMAKEKERIRALLRR